jgi:hypothetical protein
MECNKCQGLMLADYFPAMAGPTEQTSLCAWICLDCGQVTETPESIVKVDSNSELVREKL